MKNRGFPSAQAKFDAAMVANTTAASVTTLLTRPEPPPALTGAQAKVWRDVVATKPAGWFTADAFGLLADYCRAVIKSDELDKMVTATLAVKNKSLVTIKKMEAAIRMARQNGMLMNRLCSSLRLTPQSRFHGGKAGRLHEKTNDENVGGGRLWDQ